MGASQEGRASHPACQNSERPEAALPPTRTMRFHRATADRGSDDEGSRGTGNENGQSDTDAESSAVWRRFRRRSEGDPFCSDDAPQRNHWVALLFGQAIALTAASMNASSYSLVHDAGLQTQLFQLFWVYSLLACHLFLRGSTQQQQQQSSDAAAAPAENSREEVQNNNEDATNDNDDGEEETEHRYAFSLPFVSPRRLYLRIPWWVYLLMSILDVVPNFFILFSYGFTSLTSTTLLGSLTVPSTMLFTRLILSKVFWSHHYAGVVFCVLGGTMTIYLDATRRRQESLQNTDGDQSQAYVGDILAVIAALMFGLGDAVAEYTVKHLDRYEYLGMLGLFGAILTALTFPWIEHEALKELIAMPTEKTLQVCGLYLWYILSVLLYYVLETRFLVSSDATLLNLSMQAVNIWAVVFTMTAYRDSGLSPLFWLALLMVIAGVFLYEMGWYCFCCWFDDQSCKFRRRRRLSEVEIVPASMIANGYQSLSQV